MSKDGCKYYDAPAPEPEPEPAPAPAPAGDHDDHDDHDDDGNSTNAATTASGSIVVQSSSALWFGILLLAYISQ